MACRLYLRMKMREATVEEQVQWVLSYIQGGSADVWKENVIEEVVSSNTVKLWLSTSMRIYLCYDLKLKGLSSKTTLVLSNIRELNRVPSTK